MSERGEIEKKQEEGKERKEVEKEVRVVSEESKEKR